MSWGCVPLTLPGAPGVFWEPLHAWRRYAAEARALIDLSINLHAGTHGRAEEWQQCPDAWRVAGALYSAKGGDLPPDEAMENWDAIHELTGLGLDLAFGRQVLAWTVDEWLRSAQVRPAFRWEGKSPTVRLGGGGLLGALGVQIMLVVGRPDGVAMCSACGVPYAPQRRSRTDQRHYCPDRGREAAVRDAA